MDSATLRSEFESRHGPEPKAHECVFNDGYNVYFCPKCHWERAFERHQIAVYEEETRVRRAKLEEFLRYLKPEEVDILLHFRWFLTDRGKHFQTITNLEQKLRNLLELKQ